MAGSVRKSSRRKPAKKTSSKRKSAKRSTSRRKKSALRKDGKYTWVGFVKHYQTEHDMDYGEAMHAAKGAWAEYKVEHGME